MSLRALLTIFSLLLYGMAQALPCLSFVSESAIEVLEPAVTGQIPLESLAGNTIVMKGMELSFWGFFGLLFLQIPALGWLANPTYLFSLVLLHRQRYSRAAIVALAAVVIGGFGTASAFYFNLPNGSSPSEIALKQMLLGFWLWLAAPGVIAVGAFCYSSQQPS